MKSLQKTKINCKAFKKIAGCLIDNGRLASVRLVTVVGKKRKRKLASLSLSICISVMRVHSTIHVNVLGVVRYLHE